MHQLQWAGDSHGHPRSEQMGLATSQPLALGGGHSQSLVGYTGLGHKCIITRSYPPRLLPYPTFPAVQQTSLINTTAHLPSLLGLRISWERTCDLVQQFMCLSSWV